MTAHADAKDILPTSWTSRLGRSPVPENSKKMLIAELIQQNAINSPLKAMTSLKLNDFNTFS
jgi:hypothetical protein